jgi:hypothetical protein
VPKNIIKRLEKFKNVTLINVTNLKIKNWPGAFWRFIAFKLHNAKYVIFRDADSLISDREAKLVNQWIKSNKPFHIIRDWFTHTDLILAGLWGGYAPFLQNIDISYTPQTPN